MEFSSRIALLSCALLLALAVEFASAGTSLPTGKHAAAAAAASVNNLPAESERSGWSYPTGYSWSSNSVSSALPLVLIPLIYFGFLYCILLFGLSAFHHSPAYHRALHSSGYSAASVAHGAHGGASHHRYRRYDEFEDDYHQQRVLAGL